MNKLNYAKNVAKDVLNLFSDINNYETRTWEKESDDYHFMTIEFKYFNFDNEIKLFKNMSILASDSIFRYRFIIRVNKKHNTITFYDHTTHVYSRNYKPNCAYVNKHNYLFSIGKSGEIYFRTKSGKPTLSYLNSQSYLNFNSINYNSLHGDNMIYEKRFYKWQLHNVIIKNHEVYSKFKQLNPFSGIIINYNILKQSNNIEDIVLSYFKNDKVKKFVKNKYKNEFIVNNFSDSSHKLLKVLSKINDDFLLKLLKKNNTLLDSYVGHIINNYIIAKKIKSYDLSTTYDVSNLLHSEKNIKNFKAEDLFDFKNYYNNKIKKRKIKNLKLLKDSNQVFSNNIFNIKTLNKFFNINFNYKVEYIKSTGDIEFVNFISNNINSIDVTGLNKDINKKNKKQTCIKLLNEKDETIDILYGDEYSFYSISGYKKYKLNCDIMKSETSLLNSYLNKIFNKKVLKTKTESYYYFNSIFEFNSLQWPFVDLPF